jgi:hypothetical protein
MTKSTSIWIAVLTFTAVILASVFFSMNDRSAQGAMLNFQSAKVTMITSGTAADEGLIVIDRVQQKAIVYVIKGTDIVPVAGTSLLR